jgi:C6 transcription factor Pro1
MSVPACWTCRLRKKKCSRVQPICKTCAALEISCHYSEDRPEWMDGGQKQTDMAQHIKAEILQRATARKDKQYLVQVMPVHGNQDPHLVGASQGIPTGTRKLNRVSTLPNSPNLTDTDVFFTSLYLDTVFPFVFPWYELSGLSGGRSWLLSMLGDSRAIFHSAISLSSYYFTLVLAKDARHTLRMPCEQYLWDTLGRHMDLSIQTIKQAMEELNDLGLEVDVFRQARVVGGIVQLLIFESAMARGPNWNMHFSAALELFSKIFQTRGMQNGKPSLKLVLLAISRPSIFDGLNLGFPIWNTEQAAFQFFAAVLVFVDIVSSTSLKTPPRLRHWHPYLIDHRDANDAQDYNGQQLFHMEQYIGCQGWVLLLIGEVSALDARTRGLRSDGKSLVAKELDARGLELELELERGISHLPEPRPATKMGGFPTSLRQYDQQNTTDRTQERNIVTHMWAHAAGIYFFIVTKGWDPKNPAIRRRVQCVLALLEMVSSQACLRSLAWPLCVAGCVAAAVEEEAFRAIGPALGPLQAFGSVSQALRIMDCVWQRRDHLDGSWTMADCFEILGYKVLLI